MRNLEGPCLLKAGEYFLEMKTYKKTYKKTISYSINRQSKQSLLKKVLKDYREKEVET